MQLYLLLFLLIAFPLGAQELPAPDLEFASYFVTEEGKLIGYAGEKRRVDIGSLGNVPKHLINCLIATEDRDFYSHDGVSYKGLVRGLLKTITGSTQGGSTLTMQLARNLYLTHDRTISRKVTEIDIAYQLEKRYSKNEILILYLNTVYFGNSAWGIWAAAQEYYLKTPGKLTITESAALVGLLQNPAGYNPKRNSDKMLARRNEVLYNLVETGKLSEKEFQRLKKEPLNLNIREEAGRHFLEYVRKGAIEILKEKKLTLAKDQLRITTTLDMDIQAAAEGAVKKQYDQFPKGMKESQVGLVSIEPGTGKIKGMVGGNPESAARGLNRGVQIKRQPGSAFKIFLYGELLEEGYTLATPLLDAPVVVDSGKAWEWRPRNSDNNITYSNYTMQDAVKHSVNLAAARGITELTTPDSVVSFSHKLGINSEIPSLPSIALGTGEVSPLEMAASAAVFAAGGIYAEPYGIVKIEDRFGRVLYSDSGEPEVVLDSATAYLTTVALKGVIDGGTASSIRKYYKGEAAGKTGTTQNSTDVWFVGYTPKLSTAIWIGFDSQQRKLNGAFQYGGTTCAPIWGMMMADAAKKKRLNIPFTRPESVIDMELCLDSGWVPEEYCSSSKLFPVAEGRVPPFAVKEEFDIHYGW